MSQFKIRVVIAFVVFLGLMPLTYLMPPVEKAVQSPLTPGDLIKGAGNITTRTILQLSNQLANLTDEEEIQLGRDLEDRFLSHYKVVKHAGIQSTFKRLLPFTERKKIPYRCHLIRSDAVNAFAVFGGSVFFTTGLLKVLKGNNDAVALVLAHEISHIEHRHSLSVLGPAYRGKKVLSGQLFSIFIRQIAQGHSQNNEFQADRSGYSMIVKADFNPQKALSLFDVLSKSSDSHVKSLTLESDLFKVVRAHFRSHPPAQRRKQVLASIDPKTLFQSR